MREIQYPFRFALGLLSLLIEASCETATPATQVFRPPPPQDEIYEEYFERYVSRLDQFRSQPTDEFEQALLIIDASFDALIGISIVRDKELEQYSRFSCCSLTVSIIDRTSDAYLKTGEVGEFTSVLRRYHVKVSREEVDQVAASISNSKFYSDTFTDKSERVCADGTIYWLEANFNHRENLIARHACDNGFNQKIAAADALFALAVEKMPMIVKRLGDIQSSIKNHPD